MLLMNLRPLLFSLAFAVTTPMASAAVTLDPASWTQALGSAVLSGQSSTGLTWGNNTASNADNSFLFATIDGNTSVVGNQSLSLAVGETMTLSASLSFSGLQTLTTGSLQFRAGVFNTNGSATPGFGWLGYFVGNGTATSSGGLYAKNTGNTAGYIVESQSSLLSSFFGEGTVLTDGMYSLVFSMERTSTSMIISALFERQSDGANFVTVESYAHTGGAAPILSTFDRIGFLAGDGLDADRVVISNLTMTVTPEPSRALLSCLGAGVLILRRRRAVRLSAA